MKWMKYPATFLAVTLMASATFAQDETPPPPPKPPKPLKEKHEEIIIRKNEGKDEKMTIVVDGDNVTINGKPMDDFKDGNVKIIKREKRIGGPGGPGPRRFMPPHPGSDNEDFDDFIPMGINKAMLGVITAKAEDGVKITGVTKESGAEKAGLQKEDVITKVGSNVIKDPKDLTDAIAKYKPNDKVDITYKRNGKETKTTTTLSENKSRKKVMMNINGEDFNFDMPEGIEPPGMEDFNFDFHHKPRLGLQIQDLEEGKGVKVKDVDDESPAAKAGLKEGDVITQINGKDINGVDDLRNQLKDLKEGESPKFSYKRDGKILSAEVKILKKLKMADL